MNTSKLKEILITACCFLVAFLCSEIKSIDTESDTQETTSLYKDTNSDGCLDSLKSENALLPLNEGENKGPETSWPFSSERRKSYRSFCKLLIFNRKTTKKNFEENS